MGGRVGVAAWALGVCVRHKSRHSLFAVLHSVMVSISLKVTVGNNSPLSQASFPQIQVKHGTGNDTSGAFKK